MENIQKHRFVPKHSVMSQEEVVKLLKEYNISKKQLPRILAKDPVVKAVEGKVGDIIKIERRSPTAKKIINYRCVVNA